MYKIYWTLGQGFNGSKEVEQAELLNALKELMEHEVTILRVERK